MNAILEAEAATEQTIQYRENRQALRQMARRVPLHGAESGGRRFTATLQDLSRRGLRVRSETNMLCGERIVLDAIAGTDLESIACRIVRVQLTGTVEHPMFEYGIQIDHTARQQGHCWFLHFCYGGKVNHIFTGS